MVAGQRGERVGLEVEHLRDGRQSVLTDAASDQNKVAAWNEQKISNVKTLQQVKRSGSVKLYLTRMQTALSFDTRYIFNASIFNLSA